MLDGRWRANAERALDPIGRALHRAGLSADGLTLVGLGVAVATGALIANGNLLVAFFGVILTGLPDLLDGTVARYSGKAGPRGAFFDSVCDRVADGALLLGVAWHVTGEGVQLPVLAMAVLALSMLVTYERARAESLGFTARGGLMERAERLVLLAIGLLFDVLVPVLWVMLVLTALTAVHRFVMVWRQATAAASQRETVRPVRVTRRRHVATDEGGGGGGRPTWSRRLSRVPGRR